MGNIRIKKPKQALRMPKLRFSEENWARSLLSIPRLRGIQWIPGAGQPPPHAWLPLLKRIRDGGKLCQVFVSPEGARTIVKHLGGKGFLLVIDHSDLEFADPERARAFLEILAQDDISRKTPP